MTPGFAAPLIILTTSIVGCGYLLIQDFLFIYKANSYHYGRFALLKP